MKFLIDAQLPVRLARHLTKSGYDVVHTAQLPAENHTTDDEVARIADAEFRGLRRAL